MTDECPDSSLVVSSPSSVTNADRQGSGASAFARFAYPPNILGYCGPPDPAALADALAGGADPGAVRAMAERFDGAWPYLQLIARCNGIEDPLDVRVVDAYWIGSPLLERVRARDLLDHLDLRMARGGARGFSVPAEAVLAGGSAHHGFHVFCVYPWLRLLRAGLDGPALTVLDRCRIRCGRVLQVDVETVTVRDRALSFSGGLLVEGEQRVEQVRRVPFGAGPSRDLAPGDFVSLHWDWVCGLLAPEALGRLRAWTSRMLMVANASVITT